jgi:hypothetical protein
LEAIAMKGEKGKKFGVSSGADVVFFSLFFFWRQLPNKWAFEHQAEHFLLGFVEEIRCEVVLDNTLLDFVGDCTADIYTLGSERVNELGVDLSGVLGGSTDVKFLFEFSYSKPKAQVLVAVFFDYKNLERFEQLRLGKCFFETMLELPSLE